MMTRKGAMGLGLSLQWTSMQHGQVTLSCPHAYCEVLATETLSCYRF